MTTIDERGIGRWLFQLRWLLIIYLLMIPIAAWERSAVKSAPKTGVKNDDKSDVKNDDASWYEGLSTNQLTDDPELTEQVADVASGLYPQRMSPRYWQGFHAFQGSLYHEARDHFRAAIAIHPKDESLLHIYAVTAAIMDENSLETNLAIADWQWNYPHSVLKHPLEVAKSMHYYPRGLQALEAKEFAKAATFFERDLKTGRFSEELLYHYAVALVLSSENESLINTAIEAWRSEFPNSTHVEPREAAERWR